MAKEEFAEKIEKLIVDGQKDIVEKMDLLVEQKVGKAKKEILAEIRAGDDKLGKKIDANTNALYGLLQDTQGDVKRIEEKLDAHAKLPTHV